jgi:molybdopterin molybdotransferase
MAQLSNDCFVAGETAWTIEDARAAFQRRLPCVCETEHVPLADAEGRILAADLVAKSSLPAFTNSAVDGYAVRFAGLSADGVTRLPVSLRLQAGSGEAVALPAHTAARIFTGAAMPEGADTVFMQEDVEHVGEMIVLPSGLAKGANTRPEGEEIAAGAKALKAGQHLGPAELALAAACGHDHLPVRHRLRVGVFSTGDELAIPGSTLRHGQVYDSNRILLLTLLRRLGCDARDLGVLRDDQQVIAHSLRAAAGTHDLLLTSGGVSTGEADFIKPALAEVGSLDFWKFALKPGRPLSLGVIDGTAFAGLPGNPVAVFVTFTQIIRPMIAALSGWHDRPIQYLPVEAGFEMRKKAGRAEFVRVHLVRDENRLVAHRFKTEGAGILSSLVQTDGLVRLPLDLTSVRTGDQLDFVAFAGLINAG